MTKIFLDANVIITVLNKEYPLFPFAARIVSLADNKNYKLFISTLTVSIAYYYSVKQCGEARSREKIFKLAEKIKLTDSPDDCLLQIKSNKRILDIEAGMQYLAAVRAKCDIIITEDLEDFHFSKIKVLDCASFVQAFNKK